MRHIQRNQNQYQILIQFHKKLVQNFLVWDQVLEWTSWELMVMELDSMELMVVEQKKLISVLYQFVFFRFYAELINWPIRVKYFEPIRIRAFKTDLRVFVVSLSKDKSLKLVRLSGSSSVAGGFNGALSLANESWMTCDWTVENSNKVLWLVTWFHSWYMYHVFDQTVPSTFPPLPLLFYFIKIIII